MATYTIGSDPGDDYVSWTNFHAAVPSPAAGSIISFRKGDTFREQVTVAASGSEGSPITYTSHGTGALPIINGADVIGTWTEYDGWETAWSAALDHDATIPNPNYNYRYALIAADLSVTGTKVRVTVEAHSSHTSAFDGCSIGLRDGSTEDFDGAPTRITWETGNNGASVAAGATLVSDEIVFSFDSTKDHLLHLFFGNRNVECRELTDATKVRYYYQGADGTEIDDVTYTSASNVRFLKEVEVYSGTSNVWLAALTTEPNAVWFDGTFGTNVTSTVLCNGAGKWYWASNVLYVYYTEDPDGAVVIEANIRDGISLVDKSYITIQDLHIEKAHTGGIHINDDSLQTDITIQDVDIYNSGLNSIKVSYYGGTKIIPDNLTIDGGTHYHHNRSLATGSSSSVLVYHGAGEGASGGGDNLTVKNLHIDCDFVGDDPSTARNGINIAGGNDIIVESNEINGVDHGVVIYGIDASAEGTWAKAVTTRYNYIHDCADDAIWYDGIQDDDSYIYYNICADTNDNSIDVSCKATIYNNILYNSGKEMLNLRRVESTVVCKNNIFYNWNTADGGFCAIDMNWPNSSSNITSDNNCFYHATDADIAAVDSTYYTLAEWQSASSQDANSFVADPLMTDPANGDFTLQPGSPCRERGTNVALTADYDGSYVPQGLVDIGAYEYASPVALFFGINF